MSSDWWQEINCKYGTTSFTYLPHFPTSNTGNVSRIPGFKRRSWQNERILAFRSVVLGPIAPPLILQPPTPYNRHSLPEIFSNIHTDFFVSLARMHNASCKIFRVLYLFDVKILSNITRVLYLFSSRPSLMPHSFLYRMIFKGKKKNRILSDLISTAHSFDNALVSWATPPLIPQTQGLLICPEICPERTAQKPF